MIAVPVVSGAEAAAVAVVAVVEDLTTQSTRSDVYDLESNKYNHQASARQHRIENNPKVIN